MKLLLDFFKKMYSPISFIDITIFFQELTALTQAGIPLAKCFDILQDSQNNTALKQLIKTIQSQIIAGKPLSKILKKFPRYFDELTCSLIYAGEQSGTMTLMLQQITLHKEKIIAFKQRLTQALIYPSIILFTALIVIIILLTYFVPRFTELFQNAHQRLPDLTLGLIYISKFFRNYYGLTLLPLIIFFFVRFHLNKSKYLQLKLHQYILNMPIIGQLIKKMTLAHFSKNLFIIFGAGLPISEVLKITAPTCTNQVYRQAVLYLHNQILKGGSLHHSMQMVKVFPSRVIQMIKIAEESGNLEKIFEKIAIMYENEASYFINRLSQLLEPLIMIILGALIGGLVLALYLPIFKLGNVL